MRILPEILLITAGLSLGFFIASGLVALVIGLGIVTRYAGITKTAESLRFYECCCMAGKTVKNGHSISEQIAHQKNAGNGNHQDFPGRKEKETDNDNQIGNTKFNAGNHQYFIL